MKRNTVYEILVREAGLDSMSRPTGEIRRPQRRCLDFVGSLIHNGGNLPKHKASVFWLEDNGSSPEDDLI